MISNCSQRLWCPQHYSKRFVPNWKRWANKCASASAKTRFVLKVRCSAIEVYHGADIGQRRRAIWRVKYACHLQPTTNHWPWSARRTEHSCSRTISCRRWARRPSWPTRKRSSFRWTMMRRSVSDCKRWRRLVAPVLTCGHVVHSMTRALVDWTSS